MDDRFPSSLTLMQTQEGGETYLDSVAVEVLDERPADAVRPTVAMALAGGVLVAS
jgi:hypothetical protein